MVIPSSEQKQPSSKRSQIDASLQEPTSQKPRVDRGENPIFQEQNRSEEAQTTQER